MKYNFTCVDRFFKYVKIDTQSDPNSRTSPSTEKQKELANVLVQELKDMGISDARMDEFGYVYGTLPANTSKNVPIICFCAHMDTSPDTAGKNVNPKIYKNYRGEDIILSGNTTKIITLKEHPELKEQFGNDIITTDGTTLLGADDKAGVAEIMDAVNNLTSNPEVKHGTIKILFTTDEEIGRGVDHVNIEKLGAKFGYTIDGETLGQIVDETFSADEMTVIITGNNMHPGIAKDKLESSIKIASEMIGKLPKDTLSPETTAGMEGFVHPVSIDGNTEKTIVKFIIRDFDEKKLQDKENFIENIIKDVIGKYKRSEYEININETYRNMKVVLDKYPELTEYADEAVRRAGIKSFRDRTRGGTDGSRLSFMGLPSPNLFSGSHAIHSKLEWISIHDMQKAVETIVNLIIIWEEKA